MFPGVFFTAQRVQSTYTVQSMVSVAETSLMVWVSIPYMGTLDPLGSLSPCKLDPQKLRGNVGASACLPFYDSALAARRIWISTRRNRLRPRPCYHRQEHTVDWPLYSPET